jgi:hypothetical protein
VTSCPMYLARQQIHHRIHYIIRQSIAGPGCMRSRDLFDLGPDPTRYIHYPGGNSYYFDSCIEESLGRQGVGISQDDLDAIFFEFLAPETQRVITGFDRKARRKQPFMLSETCRPLHIFDKRRYHYLRFGSRSRQYIERVPEKVFRPLLNKSRDELEQYFLTAERILRRAESFNYILVVFELRRSVPVSPSNPVWPRQMDAHFIDRLCSLNEDPLYTAGLPEFKGLYEHLVKYAIMYFDADTAGLAGHPDDVREFMNRHRTYTPPPKVRMKIREAERLFGHTWKELQRMDRSALTRIYRRLALKHHPDHGGQGEVFRNLTACYKALLAKK